MNSNVRYLSRYNLYILDIVLEQDPNGDWVKRSDEVVSVTQWHHDNEDASIPASLAKALDYASLMSAFMETK